MYNNSVNKLGFWSSLSSSVFSIFFTLAAIYSIAGGLTQHVSNILVFGSSIFLALAFLIMIVSIHYSAPEEKKIWSHLGIVFATLYTAMVTMVYIVLLFTVEPYLMRGEGHRVAIFIFDKGTFTQIVDGLGYTFMSFATLFTAAVFSGKEMRWLRWFFILNGITGILVFVAYITYNTFLGAPWSITMPVSAILATKYFINKAE